MIGILQILSMFYARIQDQTLDICIKAFSHWNEETKKDQYCDAAATFEKMMSAEERLNSELSMKIDGVLLDCLMYSDTELTKV
jgi:hypothetical protein